MYTYMHCTCIYHYDEHNLVPALLKYLSNKPQFNLSSIDKFNFTGQILAQLHMFEIIIYCNNIIANYELLPIVKQ